LADVSAEVDQDQVINSAFDAINQKVVEKSGLSAEKSKFIESVCQQIE
jgi:hypothetical protein